MNGYCINIRNCLDLEVWHEQNLSLSKAILLIEEFFSVFEDLRVDKFRQELLDFVYTCFICLYQKFFRVIPCTAF